MPYIKRNNEGNIVAISVVSAEGCSEFIDSDANELRLTLSLLSNNNLDAITSDLSMVRVVEDLIDILLAKSLIAVNDLPQSVQLKLLARKISRQQGSFNIGHSDLIEL